MSDSHCACVTVRVGPRLAHGISPCTQERVKQLAQTVNISDGFASTARACGAQRPPFEQARQTWRLQRVARPRLVTGNLQRTSAGLMQRGVSHGAGA